MRLTGCPSRVGGRFLYQAGKSFGFTYKDGAKPCPDTTRANSI
jgi:hypothetical protein